VECDIFDNLDGFETLPVWKSPSVTFCIPPNPILQSLRLHAELSLRKIRTCRNIAGLQRQVDPYAAPTDTFSGLPVAGPNGQIILPGTSTIRPTLYRYAVLMERAKQLVQLAAQIEAALLASLEKGAEAAYNLLKARQELGFAQANVRLQSLRLTQSEHGITLAEKQKSRAQITASHFESLIEKGLLESEQQSLQLLSEAATAYADASTFSFISASVSGAAVIAGAVAAAIAGGAAGSVAPGAGNTAGAAAGGTGGAILGAVVSGLGGVASAFSSLAGGYSSIGAKNQTRASRWQALASYERRREDWDLQLSLGNKDVEIGQQQILIADDQKQIVEQEKTIAELQTSNAKDTIEFLNTKFNNQDLYDWMSGILGDVYGFFLQQATSLALLAQNQLAFERQETPPAYIQSDYWEAPTEGFSTDAKAPDRKGLTGSTRLLRDIYELDQYAFETNKRKLQLAKTISLALLSPAEFQRFTETGVMIFATPMELFDRGFPGHYLRLIRRVRTSVIALIPPTQLRIDTV
jgi:receptor-binding and translocation channel-forming TcA subunit of Tc toxin